MVGFGGQAGRGREDRRQKPLPKEAPSVHRLLRDSTVIEGLQKAIQPSQRDLGYIRLGPVGNLVYNWIYSSICFFDIPQEKSYEKDRRDTLIALLVSQLAAAPTLVDCLNTSTHNQGQHSFQHF